MSFAPDIERFALVSEDRDDWQLIAHDLLVIASRQASRMAALERELSNTQAHVEYWETAANKALGELRSRSQYGLAIPLQPVRRPVIQLVGNQPGSELVAPHRYASGEVVL
jgi:hypothetical protein